MIDVLSFPTEPFARLCAIVQALRSPEGCPWDKEQTALSLRDGLLEESYEAVQAINNNDDPHMKEELGDVLMLLILIANIREEAGAFTITEMLSDLNEKLIRRHPHVFGDAVASSSEDVVKQWQEIKTTVEGRSPKSSVVDSVKTHLPVLERAFEIQKKAAKAGFDWESADAVFDKIYEEIDEVKNEIAKMKNLDFSNGENTQTSLEDEIGDLIFSVVNLSRKLSIKPQLALERSTQKFATRFKYIESKAREHGFDMSSANLEVLEQYWKEAKKMGV